MESIYNKTLVELENYFEIMKMGRYKGRQLFEWLYRKRIDNFDEIINMKKSIIDILKKDFFIDQIEVVLSKSDVDVCKYLFKLRDGSLVEAVLMKHNYGNSLCISSQVGCNMGCKFCESGRLKKVRNLETSEMVLQILTIEKLLGERISHLVLMGIGEPFDNYDNVKSFIDVINCDLGIALGSRHITISTCGLIDKIELFGNWGKQVNLAISLHASNDKIRTSLMPINKVYNIESLMNCLDEYIIKTNRRVTFEYVLLAGVNDKIEDALELANLIKGMNCYVNIIPYNSTSSLEFKRSNNVVKFYDVLKKKRIECTIRREFGSNIDAACGQLRAKIMEE